MFRGTNLGGIITVFNSLNLYDTLARLVGEFCTAFPQLVEGSSSLEELLCGGQVAVPGVVYMMRMTNQDRWVTPLPLGS